MISEERIIENLGSLIRKIAPLQYVLDQLERTSIRYGLYAGTHVALLAHNRTPVDVDFLVHDDDLVDLKRSFPFAKTRDLGSGVFLYIGNDDVVEFMGKADIYKESIAYPFRLTDLAARHVTTHTVGLSRIKVVDPVDTLLLKVLLRRGPDQGKCDLEDVEALLTQVPIDETYLNARIEESNSREFVRDTLHQFGIRV